MSTTPPALVAYRTGPPGRLGRVHSVGRVQGGRGVPTGPPRRFHSHALMYVWGGHGRYRDARHDLPLGPGHLVHVLPGHAHWYGVTGAGTWNEVHLVFSGPAFDLAARQGLVDPVRPVRRLTPVEHWRDRLDRFRTVRPPRGPAGADDEVCEVLRLLVEIAARDAVPEHDGAPAGPPGWLVESRVRLGDDLGGPLDLRAVALAVGMSYETWRKRFQAATGEPPARYRQRRRVEAAGELLRRTSLTNRDIAASLGFTDEHHLAKQFRRLTGLTAGEFRRTLG
ncbi:AraC family transcriptional regulator [Micromonospora sp. NPDC050980]|uniref:helix-turn-helix domain-containing protein n=1 Tax=Micromonospora sp. NPDC050980 TaxID=3155161 RepID=UPI0033F935EF